MRWSTTHYIAHNNNNNYYYYGDYMWYYVSKWVCGVMLLVNECVTGYNKSYSYVYGRHLSCMSVAAKNSY